MPESANVYFAPTYFCPSYFSPFGVFDLSGSVEDETIVPYRDRDAFDAILAELRYTGEFAAVLFGSVATRPDSGAGADLSPTAIVTPERWTEVDEEDPTVLLRTVHYKLTIIARSNNVADQYDMLDRLSCVAQNAIEGTDLGGGSLPALTRVREGTFDSSSVFPDQAVMLHGEFSYLVPSLGGHSTAF